MDLHQITPRYTFAPTNMEAKEISVANVTAAYDPWERKHVVNGSKAADGSEESSMSDFQCEEQQLQASVKTVFALLDKPEPLSNNLLILTGRLSEKLYHAFTATSNVGHLITAIGLLEKTCEHALAEDVDPSLAAKITSDHCSCLTVKYGLTKSDEDFHKAATLLFGALPNSGPLQPVFRWNLWSVMLHRYHTTEEREDLDRAIQTGKDLLNDKDVQDEEKEQCTADLEVLIHKWTN